MLAKMECHYSDVIMDTMASQITSLTIVYSIVYSGADQRKHQSSASLAFVRGINRWQRASNAEYVSIWWRHHALRQIMSINRMRRGNLWLLYLISQRHGSTFWIEDRWFREETNVFMSLCVVDDKAVTTKHITWIFIYKHTIRTCSSYDFALSFHPLLEFTQYQE